MSVLRQVFHAIQTGTPVNRVAATLGIDAGLADLAIDHWVKLGLITPAGELGLVCPGCAPGVSTTPKSPKCTGCPFAR